VRKNLILKKKITENYLKKFFQLGAIVIDLRSKTSYQQAHAPATTNIPFDQLSMAIPALQQINRVYILVCESGAISSMAVNMLRAAGIEAYNGGSWQQINEQLFG
jgi:rhodanese-related sulfurtransferase